MQEDCRIIKQNVWIRDLSGNLNQASHTDTKYNYRDAFHKENISVNAWAWSMGRCVQGLWMDVSLFTQYIYVKIYKSQELGWDYYKKERIKYKSMGINYLNNKHDWWFNNLCTFPTFCRCLYSQVNTNLSNWGSS